MRGTLLYAFLSGSGFYGGYWIGKLIERRRIQRGITRAVDDFSGRMKSAMSDMDRVITEARKATVTKPPADVLADEPLPIKASDIESSLAGGGLAMFYGKGGSC